MTLYNDSYLMHYGILGMKWGVRRYQNKDGTYTEAGKKRKERMDKLFTQDQKAGKDKAPISRAEKLTKDARRITDEASNISRTASSMAGRKKSSSRDYSNMTNAELRAVIERKNLERQYASLTEPEVSNGLQTVTDILSIVGSTVGIVGGAVAIASTVRDLKK